MVVTFKLLVIPKPGEQAKSIELKGSRFSVGRAQADLVIKTSTISREHCLLFAGHDGSIWIKDMGSRNGTRVNGKKAQLSIVKRGDTIQAGEAVIRVLECASESDLIMAEDWKQNYLCLPKDLQKDFEGHFGKAPQKN